MGFPRQEYWNGLLFPSPGDLSHPGIKLESLMSPALAVSTHACMVGGKSKLDCVDKGSSFVTVAQLMITLLVLFFTTRASWETSVA